MKIETIDQLNPPKAPTVSGLPPRKPHPCFLEPKVEAVDHQNPPKVVAPKVAAPIAAAARIVLILCLLLTGVTTRATGLSIVMTNTFPTTILNFALYTYNGNGFYTLTGLTGISSNAVATISGPGPGTAYTGICEINTNNNFAWLVPFSVTNLVTGFSTNFFLQGSGAIIRLKPAAPDNLNPGPAFNTTNNPI